MLCQWQKILLVQHVNLVAELLIHTKNPLLKNQTLQASKSGNLYLYKKKSTVDFFRKTIQSFQNAIFTALPQTCQPNIFKTYRLLIFLSKTPEGFSSNREILKYRRKIGS